MLKFLTILGIAFCTFNADAGDTVQPCNGDNGTYKQMMSGECACTKDFPVKEIPKFAIPRIKFKLIMACGISNNSPNVKQDAFLGGFEFESNEVFKGVVTYSPQDNEQDWFFLSSDGFGGNLNIASTKQYRALKIPSGLGKGEICISAKAKIRVKRYYDGYAQDSDGTGTWINAFDVIEVGKYAPCKY